MENTYENIKYKTITYILNNDNGYYIKQPTLVTFNKLPSELKVEETQKDFLRKQGANYIIRGRIKNGQYTFFTGLIPLPNLKNTYFGNNYENVNGNKKYSLIAFKVSEDNTSIQVYYFNHFYKENRSERIEFLLNFINSLFYD